MKQLPCINCITLPICRTLYLKEYKKQCEIYSDQISMYSLKMPIFRALGELLSKRLCVSLGTYVEYSSGAINTDKAFNFNDYMEDGTIPDE